MSIKTVTVSNSNLSLDLAPEIGGSVAAFRFRKDDGNAVDIFRPYKPSGTTHTWKVGDARAAAPEAVNMGNFPMTPTANRIKEGRLNFNGKIYDMKPLHGQENNYLHGDGWRLPWEVTEQSDSRVKLELKKGPDGDTPHVYDAEQIFILEDNALTIEMAITNKSGIALPFTIGAHPFFPRKENTVVKASLPKVWMCDEEMYPVKLVDTPKHWDFANGVRLADKSLPLGNGFKGNDRIDNCFTGWDRVADIIQPDDGVCIRMTADPMFDKFVIWNPGENGNCFAAEAVMNIIDAYNLAAEGMKDTGTAILNPGQSMRGKTRFEVKPY